MSESAIWPWARFILTAGSLAGGIALAVISTQQAKAAGTSVSGGRIAGIIILFALWLLGVLWIMMARRRQYRRDVGLY